MTITVNDIMNFMLSSDYTDYEPDGDIMRFYLYLKDGSLTRNHDEADRVITEDIDISRWMDDDSTERFEEEFFDTSNEDFELLCRWFAHDINNHEIKFYDLGRYTASITKTSSGYYMVTVKEDGIEYEKWMFSDKTKALEEILSFAEMDEDDWVKEEE